MFTSCKTIFKNVLKYFDFLDKSLVVGDKTALKVHIYEAGAEDSTIESLFLFYGIQ